jgi:hypothetical protein
MIILGNKIANINKKDPYVFYDKIEELRQNISNLLQERSDNSSNFTLKLKTLIKKLFCQKSLSLKEKFFTDLYEKSQEYINNKMDVINYLYLTREYTYLKCVLFDEVQAMCLSFSKNPKLYENSRFMNLHKDPNDIIEKIVKFYANNPNLSQKENRLFEILPDDIKNIIVSYKSSLSFN